MLIPSCSRNTNLLHSDDNVIRIKLPWESKEIHDLCPSIDAFIPFSSYSLNNLIAGMASCFVQRSSGGWWLTINTMMASNNLIIFSVILLTAHHPTRSSLCSMGISSIMVIRNHNAVVIQRGGCLIFLCIFLFLWLLHSFYYSLGLRMSIKTPN